MTVSLEINDLANGQVQVGSSGLIRTARLLSRGEVFVPTASIA